MFWAQVSFPQPAQFWDFCKIKFLHQLAGGPDPPHGALQSGRPFGGWSDDLCQEKPLFCLRPFF